MHDFLADEVESAGERTSLLSRDQRHETEHNNPNTSRKEYGASSSFCTSCKLRCINGDVADDTGLRIESKRRNLTTPAIDDLSSIADLSSCTSSRAPSVDDESGVMSSRRKWRNMSGTQPRSPVAAGSGGKWYDSVSLQLQNSGSVARDHLASERTFLAYMRTSLVVASAGVALVQLLFSISEGSKEEIRRIRSLSRPLGGAVVGIGLYILVMGVMRYFTIQSSLVNGYFPAAKVTVISIAFALLALVTTVFSVLFTYKVELSEDN